MNKGSPVLQSQGDVGPSFEAEGTVRAEDAEREEPGVSAAQTGSVAAVERVAMGGGTAWELVSGAHGEVIRAVSSSRCFWSNCDLTWIFF